MSWFSCGELSVLVVFVFVALCQTQAEQPMKKDGKQVRELIKLIYIYTMFILIRDMFFMSQYVRMFYILWHIHDN